MGTEDSSTSGSGAAVAAVAGCVEPASVDGVCAAAAVVGTGFAAVAGAAFVAAALPAFFGVVLAPGDVPLAGMVILLMCGKVRG
jgi:hypothetical protein